MNILRILKAKFRNKDNMKGIEWYDTRTKICESCPLNSLLNVKRGFRYWLWDIINFKKPFCTVCGCELKAKISEELEECPKGYWKQIE